ncbi:MAG: DUF6125 family protein [Candidatus Helarchaeota archaeon]
MNQMTPNLDKEYLQLIRSALTTIDGLWFLEVENKFGFETAFDLDLKVWKKYGAILIKRIKKIFSIEDETLSSFLRVLEILCAIDGTRFEIQRKSSEEILLSIQYCPWWENLKRSKREKLVRCDIVDKEIFPKWAETFNPNIEFQLIKSIPAGHSTCEWLLSLKK